MRKDRLLKLADFLEKVVAKKPKYKFNMNKFGDIDFDPNRCSTAACAFGWATVRFPRALKMDSRGAIQYKDDLNFDAASGFFQIDTRSSFRLFGLNTGCKSPKQVARNIRRFVKEKSRERKTQVPTVREAPD